MPVIAFVVAALAAAATGLLIKATHVSEDNLRQTHLLKFQPDKFQGSMKSHRYFEGWYYKLVTSIHNDTEELGNLRAIAVVPGIFYGNSTESTESHAFIFVTLNGERQHYYHFPLDEFTYADASEDYYIQVGDNLFTHNGISLNLYPRETDDDAELILSGNLTFYNTSPWPVSLFSLGAMGPVGWMPGLECTHGILSFDHEIQGSLTMHDRSIENTKSKTIIMDGGRGYTEKDYGRSFPSTWIWIQTNSFSNNPGTSLFVSIARVPIPFGWEFPGFTAAIWHKRNLIPFATWSGAKFEDLRVSKDEVFISMRSGRQIIDEHKKSKRIYCVEITVNRQNVPEVLLYAPVNFSRMEPFVWEALRATVHLRLTDCYSGEVLIEDTGDYAGLEVHGDVRWLVDNVCGKTHANRLICL